MNNHIKGKATSKIGAVSIGPGLGAALLAKASCPLCYPAIGGVLSSIGLGFLFQGIYLYIFMALFFSFALFGLYYRANERRGYSPLLLGILGVFIVILGQYLAYEVVFYIGITILTGASIWNLIPIKKECSACINNKGETNE